MRAQWLCFFELLGDGHTAYSITANSSHEIRQKYPRLFILEHGKTIEEIVNAPSPEDAEKRYEERLGEVRSNNRIDVKDDPNFEFAFHYAVPRKMNLYFCKYINKNGEVRFPKIFASSEDQLRMEFPKIELVKPPVGPEFLARPFPSMPVFCLEFKSSLVDYLEN